MKRMMIEVSVVGHVYGDRSGRYSAVRRLRVCLLQIVCLGYVCLLQSVIS